MSPKNKATFAALVVVAGTPAAAFADALYDEIRVCRSLPSDEARLACYDAAADRAGTATPAAADPPPVAATPPSTESTAARPAASSASAAPATAVAPAAAAVSQEDLFGKNAKEVQRTVEEATGTASVDSLRARVTNLQQAAPDKVVISLDNGQVWRQTTSSNLRLRKGDEIEIERGALGSYILQKVGSKRTMRVQRMD